MKTVKVRANKIIVGDVILGRHVSRSESIEREKLRVLFIETYPPARKLVCKNLENNNNHFVYLGDLRLITKIISDES